MTYSLCTFACNAVGDVKVDARNESCEGETRMRSAFPTPIREWFADSPKQWLHNAYQNKAAGCPRFICRPQRGGYMCSLAPLGLPAVSATGRTRKAAETNCALQAVGLEVDGEQLDLPTLNKYLIGHVMKKLPHHDSYMCNIVHNTKKMSR